MVNQEKKEMRLKAYAIWWNEKLGNVKLHQMNDMKKMPRKGKDWIEKDAQKGIMNDMKKDAQMGKECDEKDENGLPNVNLHI